ncbi:hypothetical protein [Candidatus Uabimicrobium amorphum]|uniref:Uncharacterized protein n=1 Tax=Uabimicrobium amorphum TaxID=2596890 RepID=A0A5S9INM3_UABAM|nr:hypothetical protein [Candidatus Uabimicrobium amorphum]BBM83865.1 hypothetical protein UABAM_02220 [Candidatus Uabimicrobium amorphum]
MKNLTYSECRNFIKGITQVAVYENKNAINLPELIDKYGLQSKILIISGDNKQAVLFPFGNKYWVIYFYKNKFYKEKHVTSPLRYQSKNYSVSCYQVSLNELIIWFDSHRYMQEQINLSREDSEILSRHNIKVEKKKTTRKFLFDAYAKTITGKEQVLPDVKKVVDKYSKPIEPLLMVFEQESKKDDIEINEHDSAVFTRYGFHVDCGKTKYKTLCDQVRKCSTDGKLGVTVSPEDLAVFRKYGITFAPSGEAKGKIRLPVTPSMLFKRFVISVIFLAILGGVTWHFYGPAIRYYFGQQTYKIRANLDAANAKQELKDISEATSQAQDLYKLIVKEYPATLGYIDPHPRLKPLILETKNYVKTFEKMVTASAELLVKEEYEKVLKSLQPHQDEHDKYQVRLDIIRRVVSKLKTTRYINRALKNEWLQEENINTALRKLRNYVFSAQELIDSIEEEQMLIATKYQEFQNTIPKDPNVAVKMNIYRSQVEKLEDTIRKAEKLFLQENDREAAEKILSGSEKSSQSAEEILQPYEKFQSDIIKGLTYIYEDINQKIEALETLRQKKSSKGEVLKMIAQKSQEYSDLQDKTPQVESLLRQVTSIPKNLGIAAPPKQIAASIGEAKNYAQNLRSLIAAANEDLANNKTADAKEKLEKSASKYEKIMEKLTAASDIMREIKQTAKALQIENSKRAKEYSKRIVYMRKQQSTLQNMLLTFKKNIDNFNKVLPPSHAFRKELQRYMNKYTSFERLAKTIDRELTVADNYFENKKINEALTHLKEKNALTKQAQNSIGEMTQSFSEIKRFITVVEQQKRQFQVAKRVLHIEKKLETYTSRLQNILLPLEKKASQLRKEFPTSKGYQDINSASQQTLKLARRIYSFYRKKLTESQTFTNKKMYEKALNVLAKYEGKRLSPANFVQDLKNLQSDLNNKLGQAKLQKQSNRKTNEAQVLIDELTVRRAKLQQIIPTLKSDLATLRNLYPNVLKETVGFSGAEKYLQFAQQEIEEINELLQESQLFMVQKKYSAVVTLLKPYTKGGEIISVLSTLETLQKNSRSLIAKMQNPQQKQQVQKKLLAQQQKERRLKDLQRSPGDWYDNVTQVFNQYEKLSSQIVGSLKGRGSRFVHSTIQKRMRTIREYPQQIAEIDYSLEFIKQKGKNIANEISLGKKKDLAKYLQTKNIDINVDSEIFQLQSAVSNLRGELRLGGWIEEETLRQYLRALDAIKRAFEQQYREVSSPVISLQAQIPH